MRTRVLTALGLVPVLLIVYFGPELGFLVLSAAAGVAVTLEALSLARAGGADPLPAAAAAGVLLLNLSFFRPQHLPPVAALALAAAIVLGAWMILRGSRSGSLQGVTATLAGVVMPGFLLAFQVALRGVERERPDLHALNLLMFLYAVVFGNDIAAYVVGRLLGRRKLVPSVSPGKTVEGFLGGLAGGIAAGTAFELALPTGMGLVSVAGLAFLLAAAAVLGDLSVSLLKRGAGVKDTGRLLPGHGGFLDRLDGLLFASPLLYLVVTAGGTSG